MLHLTQRMAYCAEKTAAQDTLLVRLQKANSRHETVTTETDVAANMLFVTHALKARSANRPQVYH
jgi:hypothetical protein